MKNDAMDVFYGMKNAAFAAADKHALGAGVSDACDALLDILMRSWFASHHESAAILSDGLAVPMVASKSLEGFRLKDFSSGISQHNGPCFAVGVLGGAAANARGLHESCTSIAYLNEKQLLAAVVYDPVHVELFHAVQGMGAYLNGKSIKAARTKYIMEAFVSIDHGMLRTGGHHIYKLIDQTQHVRSASACGLELCYTACGRTDAVVRHNEVYFEYAAGLLIAQEAGATIMETDGTPWASEKEYGERRSLIAACPGIAAEMAQIFA